MFETFSVSSDVRKAKFHKKYSSASVIEIDTFSFFRNTFFIDGIPSSRSRFSEVQSLNNSVASFLPFIALTELYWEIELFGRLYVFKNSIQK